MVTFGGEAPRQLPPGLTPGPRLSRKKRWKSHRPVAATNALELSDILKEKGYDVTVHQRGDWTWTIYAVVENREEAEEVGAIMQGFIDERHGAGAVSRYVLDDER